MSNSIPPAFLKNARYLSELFKEIYKAKEMNRSREPRDTSTRGYSSPPQQVLPHLALGLQVRTDLPLTRSEGQRVLPPDQLLPEPSLQSSVCQHPWPSRLPLSFLGESVKGPTVKVPDLTPTFPSAHREGLGKFRDLFEAMLA